MLFEEITLETFAEVAVDADRLIARIDARKPDIDKATKYYEGDQPLVYVGQKFKEKFGGLFEDWADNFCGLITDAVEERLRPVAFDFGAEEGLTRAAWEDWKRNEMLAWAQTETTETLNAGTGYTLTWFDADDERLPVVTTESALECHVEVNPLRRSQFEIGVKTFLADDGLARAIVYYPTAVVKLREVEVDEKADPDDDALRWEPWIVDGEDWPIANPLGVVPLTPIVTRAKTTGFYEGRSEIRPAIPVQNAINLLAADMIVGAEFSAFRQKYFLGLELETGDDGKPVAPAFDVGADRAIVIEDDNVTAGEFAETDLQNFVNAIEMLTNHLATQTRTPPHYFFLGGQYPSGDAIKSSETGLVAKCRDRASFIGVGWSRVARLMAAIRAGKPVSDVPLPATRWGEIEYRSEAEVADAALKMAQLGVPLKFLWERYGATPEQIEAWQAERTVDTFERMITLPATDSPTST